MLQVMTSEIHADFTGFPLSLDIPPDCSCSEFENAGCSECGTKTLIFDAAQREDGATAQRLVLRARTQDLRRLLHEALDYIEVDDA